MPWTIYRYIFKDLLKLLVTATVVLVLVISFAAAIKPLSEGLLGPETLLRYVIYLAPTMLGFILPFAAALSSTLVFSRIVEDNELVVCRASGIGYRMILLPVIFLGLVLTLSLFFLSNWVVPSFYRRAALMLEKDMMQVIVSQVEQMRPVTLGDIVLYADAVDDSHPAPVIPGDSVQPSKLIRLRGVAVGQLDQAGRLRSDSTAQKADVLLYRVEGQTWATMQLDNVVFYDAVRGDLFSIEQWVLPQILLPSPFKDDPRFLSWPQMRQLGDDPELYDLVRDHKQQLAESIATEVMLGQISKAITDAPPGGDGVVLFGMHGREKYEITAPAVSRSDSELHLLASGAVPIRVVYRQGGRITRRIEAQKGKLWIEPGEPQPEPWVRVELAEAQVYDLGADNQGAEHSTVLLPRGRRLGAVLEPLMHMKSGELLQAVHTRYPNVKTIMDKAGQLRFQIVYLFRQVVAQLNERAALAVACLLMIVLGALLSMKLGGGMPLVIYFWSFMSAIVVVIVTHSGENIASHPGMSRTFGLSVVWLGDLLLLMAVGGTYWRLARN